MLKLLPGGLLAKTPAFKLRPSFDNERIFRRPSTSPDRHVPGDDERSIGSSSESWTMRDSGEESPGYSGSPIIDPSGHAAPTSGDAAVIDIMSVNADSVVQKMLGRIAQEYGLGFHPVRT